MALNIRELHLSLIKDHVQSCLPEEGCGVLGGEDDVILDVVPVTNVLHSITRFRMDPSEQLEAFLLFEEKGIALNGIFHSHPNGPDHPSETDLREFAYPGIPYLILMPDGDDWSVNGYLLDDDGFMPIKVNII